MLNVAFVMANGSPDDRTKWSGIPFSSYHELIKFSNVEKIIINQGFILKYLNKFFAFINMLFGYHYMSNFSVITSFFMSKKVERQLRNGNFDIAFIIGSELCAYLNIDFPILYLTDAVFSRMINYYDSFSNLSKEGIKQGNIIQKKCLDNADKIIVASDWAKRGCIEDYSINNNKIEVINFGANIENKLNIKSKSEVKVIELLFIGVDWDRKGGDFAIEVVDYLNQLNTQYHYRLKMIGSKPSHSIANEDVEIYGFINKNNSEGLTLFSKIISESDIFILPTKAECAGIAFCEASAYGLPSITFDTGGIANYVINDVNGYRLPTDSSYKEFAETIKHIVENEKYLDKLKESTRNYYSEQLSWDIWGHKVQEIFAKYE